MLNSKLTNKTRNHVFLTETRLEGWHCWWANNMGWQWVET